MGWLIRLLFAKVFAKVFVDGEQLGEQLGPRAPRETLAIRPAARTSADADYPPSTQVVRVVSVGSNPVTGELS